MNLTIWPIIGFTLLMVVVIFKSILSFRTTLFCYLVVYTASLAFNPFEATNPMFKYNLIASHAQSLAYLLLILLLTDKNFPIRFIWQFISWLFMLDAVAILFGWQGLTWGLSFDTAFIALLLPVFYKPIWYRQILCLVGLAAIYKVGGATAYFVLGASLVGAAISYKNWLWLTIICPLFAIGYFSQGYNLYLSQGRLEMWTAWGYWWVTHANHYIGTGLGSFEWLSNTIYSDTGGYTFAHNDYFQMLFETGIVGCVLFIGTIIEALYSLRRNHVKFSVGMGLCAFMLTYSPLHIFHGMLIGILLMVDARNERLHAQLGK